MIVTGPRLDRTTFQTSRLLDFASEKELVAQTGHSRVIAEKLIERDKGEEVAGR